MRINKASLKDHSGFTLVEMITVIAIIAIMTILAIPSFAEWLPKYRLKSAARDLYSNFQVAKMTAVKSNHFCAVVFNKGLDEDGDGVVDTNYDYVVFEDADQDLELDDGEIILIRKQFADYKNVSMQSVNFNVNDNNLPAVAFMPNSLTTDNNGGFGAGTTTLQNTNNSQIGVVVAGSGSVSIQ